MSQTLTYVIGQDRRPHVDNVQDFKVNFDGSNTNWVQARQYERSMRQVFVNIKNEDGTPLDLTGCNVWFEGLLPKNSAGDFRVIDDKGYVALDPTAGRFRFDMPGHAFTVAGSYRQAFFRILKDGNSITTLEFDLDVLADKVIDGLVPRTYISPVEELINEIEAKYQDSTDKLTKMTSDFVDQFTQSMNTLKALGATVQNGLDALEQKIKQDGLFTQAEADAFKQAIEKELASRIGDVNKFKAQGTNLTEKVLNEFSVRAENVTWHGVVGDGKTDNTQALQDLSKWVDQQGGKQVLYFPPGKYLWNETVQFNTPVVLTGTEESWLKYTGTGDGLLLGPDGLTDDNYINYRSFTVKNLCFTGGDNSKYLIRFNKHITQGRVTDCQFHNAAGTGDDAYAIYFDVDNWDGRVSGCQWDATADAGQRQFVSMAEYGNSRIVVENNLVTSLTAMGTAVFLNGVDCQIIANKIEGFINNVRLGAMAYGSVVAYNYFEKSGSQKRSAVIELGDLDPSVETFPYGIQIIGNYANLHNVPGKMWSYFLGPSNDKVLINKTNLESNFINAGAWTSEEAFAGYIVYENNLPNQMNNFSSGNKFGIGIKGIIDTSQAGSPNAELWESYDSNQKLWSPINEDQDMVDNVFVHHGQNYYRNVLDDKWQWQFQEEFDKYQNFIVRSPQMDPIIKIYEDGQVSFGKGDAVTNYDFAHPLKATTIGVSQQVDDGDAGQLYEGKDGNLYYRNIAGVRKKLTN